VPELRERAILVAVELTGRRKGAPEAGESLDELAALAGSAGAEVAGRVAQTRPAFDPATLAGPGKLEELKLAVRAQAAGMVIFDRELSGMQHRNLERALEVKVLDRTQLILDIFARRARTREGQLQVELAQLNYLLPRLTGRGAAMSRLGGGIGTRGPGETQLETDRRRIRARIKRIEQDLEAVRGFRGVQRRLRQSVPLAALSLVGYTNAGKSTLFNRLTGADVLADRRMFATLDPTLRQLTLPSRRRVLLGDTVGFIRQLPTTLVRAFRATLEEVAQAALLLHVVDAGAPEAAGHCEHVRAVLSEIGAQGTPQLLVLNKCDRLPDGGAAAARRLGAGMPVAAVSARTGEGVEALLKEIDRRLPDDPVENARFRFPPEQYGQIHLLHGLAVVTEERYGEDGCEIAAAAPASLVRRLAAWRVPT
jgi:GTP-binding protein HflX